MLLPKSRNQKILKSLQRQYLVIQGLSKLIRRQQVIKGGRQSPASPSLQLQRTKSPPGAQRGPTALQKTKLIPRLRLRRPRPLKSILQPPEPEVMQPEIPELMAVRAHPVTKQSRCGKNYRIKLRYHSYITNALLQHKTYFDFQIFLKN